MAGSPGSELAATAALPGDGAAAPPRFARLDTAIAWVTEVPAAILVVLEVVVLFAGVVSRYVFRDPLVWSDELASALFLWLAMLGAVIALRRDEHMRLTAVLTRVPARRRSALEAVGAMVVAAFVLLIIAPAQRYIASEWAIITPALQFHNSFRVAGIGVGAVLMLVIAGQRLIERVRPREAAAALALVAAIAAALWLAKPLLLGLGQWNLFLFFVVLVALCVAIGVPIAFAFGVAAFAYLALVTRVPLTVLIGRMDEGMSHIILLAVPLFVFLGNLIEATGLARAMVDFLAALLGHVRGGLAYVLLGAMYLVSGISGSKAADMAAIAPVLFPEMRRRGARGDELIALLASSGAMSETIPPSLVLITIGSVTGVSIAALFTGGLVPAAVMALALCIIARIRARHEDLSKVRRATIGEIARTFIIALPALILPFVIRTSVVEGIATATEVSTIGIVYAFIAGILLYHWFDWRRLYPMLVETASLSGAILLIIGTATGMAWALTQSGFSHQLATMMATMPGGKAGFLAVSILAFVVLGSVLEGIPAIVLFGPLLFPIARAIGVHEVHYAMIVILAMGIGLFAPPFGVGFYAACAIGRVNPDDAMVAIWPYLGVLLAALVIIAASPWLSIGFL